ncbi:hypothetical protein Pla110_32750 [Polystyrenella longa]|uniref:DUF2946 domain-containing protein n=1 Tax=Polystyrenella longa TaxID=2528007 RepID=A0A518CQP0_9PLAN|nr:hypothetical protein [Polystyrenella longa]QDU81533.1 hypothetical protein Pla110_32750 [Polystyrenella longa]
MSTQLTKWTMLTVYVSAMVISIVAHDPFHRHTHESVEGDHVSKTQLSGSNHSHGKHRHHGHDDHVHDHSHGDHHDETTAATAEAPHSHQHNHDGHEDCPVCEFLSLKCIEATVAEVESASELITLASQNGQCYHAAFSPYQPPSRAPPVC